MTRFLLFAAAAVLLFGCGPAPSPLLPSDYRTKYQQVRSCMLSADHGFTGVVIYASPEAAPLYATDAGTASPEGSTIVKEEYEEPECGKIRGYSLMVKQPNGEPGDSAGWKFAQLRADRTEDTSARVPGCVSCHNSCGEKTDLQCAR